VISCVVQYQIQIVLVELVAATCAIVQLSSDYKCTGTLKQKGLNKICLKVGEFLWLKNIWYVIVISGYIGCHLHKNLVLAE